MLLSAEVMREYDRRFVYKRVFGARVDRSTQTEEGELDPWFWMPVKLTVAETLWHMR